MKIIPTLLAGLTALSIVSGATAAEMEYKHQKGGDALMEIFDGSTWWEMFANCAGIYAAAHELSNDADYKERFGRNKNLYATIASFRFAKDNNRPGNMIHKEIIQVADEMKSSAISKNYLKDSSRIRWLARCDGLQAKYEKLVPGMLLN